MLHIREALSKDAALISRIISISWRSSYQALIDPVYLARLPEEYWLPSMRAWLSSGRMYGCIAEVDGVAAGCVVYGRARDEDHADWGEIVALYLLPEAVGKGVGSALLRQAIAILREDGYDRVYLWFFDGNDHAERFYLRHGFRRTEDRVHYKLGSGDVTDIRFVLEEQHGRFHSTLL